LLSKNAVVKQQYDCLKRTKKRSLQPLLLEGVILLSIGKVSTKDALVTAMLHMVARFFNRAKRSFHMDKITEQLFLDIKQTMAELRDPSEGLSFRTITRLELLERQISILRGRIVMLQEDEE
jgi:hypothetical protein